MRVCWRSSATLSPPSLCSRAQDNADVLDTIEKAPIGVLRMLDDYCKMLQVRGCHRRVGE